MCSWFGDHPTVKNGDISGYDSTTPTFVETLVSQKSDFDTNFRDLYFSTCTRTAPPLLKGSGEITFGGIDESKIQSD